MVGGNQREDTEKYHLGADLLKLVGRYVSLRYRVECTIYL